MEKFEHLFSKYSLLDIENIDTDQIIPAIHLKSIERTNFGQNLFSNWRNEDKLDLEEWPINKGNNKILVAGKNFGCGSSREHAVWALADYGFKVILSTQIADIFSLNALNNGVLPIQIPEQLYVDLMKYQHEKWVIEVDLDKQQLSIPVIDYKQHFPISVFKKSCILNGYDTVDYLVSIHNEIQNYEHSKKKI